MKISLSTEELLEGANQINARKEDIIETIALLESQVMAVCDNWEGAAQSSFVTVFSEIVKNFNDVFPDSVEAIATQMTKVANDFDTTDTANANLG